MADDNEPTTEETEESPEVEAHTAETAEEVLDLQGISIDQESRAGFTSPGQAGSCSSCVGSLCM
ncbi:hypothetical protein [Actinacidiphila acididurans]|uniref:Thiazolylpeptide-type bacteriocin n=1 Tax=Actinacidiphila acididurans TaxID=2784346 RepID=A0ABS2U426_9ACTN|nr:hypothetical protein [Actinacidiphila acididurans]MBM9508898.1 hypothetical protein [Actinacidiphila acididurans]